MSLFRPVVYGAAMTGASSPDGEDDPPAEPAPERPKGTAGIAVLTAAVQVVGTVIAVQGQTVKLSLLGYALLIVSGLLLTFRNAHPTGTFIMIAAATTTYHLLDYPPGPTVVALAVAAALAIKAGHHHLVWVNAVVWYAVYAIFADTTAGHDLVVAAWTLGFGLLAEALIAMVRTIRQMWSEQERLREEQELRKAGDERLRIAQELHDVLGHHLSLINVRAGVGLHLMDRQPDQARAALDTIKQASAEALREVQSVINALNPAGQAAPLAPAPGLGRLDGLTLDAGLPVRTTISGDPRPLPPEIDLAAYRIVQEALTNVRRHAGTGAAAGIVIDYQPEELMVQVEDDGGAPGLFAAFASFAPTAAEGNGISGMRERARALGGSLTAQRLPGGGWQVRALLPLPQPAPESEPESELESGGTT